MHIMDKETRIRKTPCFGCCCPKIFKLFKMRRNASNENLERQQRQKSKEIDKFLAKDEYLFRRQVKLLLLGAGESGKSTFLKQMRIIHGIEFEKELLDDYRMAIYQNIVRGIQVLIDAREKLDIKWDISNNDNYGIIENESKNVKLMKCNYLNIEQFKEYVPTIKRLWSNTAIKDAFQRRREYQISDSVSYFLDELDRISKSDYIPTNKDILHCRKATKSVIEFGITIKNIPFVFIDVGGQRTQRQKWTKCFDSSITSMIFFVSSSEFDQVLAEDKKTNRLEESKNIFDTLINNYAFRDISTILFLNKTDLLEQKLRIVETDFRKYYPQFNGDAHSTLDVQNFMLKMFLNVRKKSHTRVYHHFTNAVDTRNIRIVFNSVKDIILQRNLHALMLQ